MLFCKRRVALAGAAGLLALSSPESGTNVFVILYFAGLVTVTLQQTI
jgi:predicted membrane-bound dolichyl-phosphate-mannose-protein mannosyltransferase